MRTNNVPIFYSSVPTILTVGGVIGLRIGPELMQLCLGYVGEWLMELNIFVCVLWLPILGGEICGHKLAKGLIKKIIHRK